MKDCNFCIHNEVCGAKWTIREDVRKFPQIELDITCKHFIPAMNEPVETKVEAVAEAAPKKTVKRTIKRRAKK